MRWDSRLDELQVLLADLYPTDERSLRPAEQGGLTIREIDFSGRAIDIWHNILVEAVKSNCVTRLLEFVVKDSGSREFAEAYGAYLSKPAQAGKAAAQRGGPLEDEHISISRMPVTGHSLFGRKRELKLLDKAWADDRTNVLSVIAWGGVGKSALVNEWLRQMAKDDYRGAERVYAWSFYRQGSSEPVISADEFIACTLGWFGDESPNEGSAWDKGVRLANLIRDRRTLLLLDGLEPLQYPPGPQEGRLKDEALRALLRELASSNPGLCVIATRLPVSDLGNFEGEGGEAQRLDLEQLSPTAGAQILRSQGAKGTAAQLQRASEEFDGHALALTLLGSYLSEVYKGDITQRDKIRKLDRDTLQGNDARRVMASYEEWFGEGPEVAVLRILGFFDRPADERAVGALRAAPPIRGLTDVLENMSEDDWRLTLGRLRRAQLLADEDQANPSALDAHPLVRDYFRTQLTQKFRPAWREGNDRLYEHFKRRAEDLPKTLHEMETLMQAVAYGCNAGRQHDALTEVYVPRIMRGKESFTANKLNARGALLAVLSNFFEGGRWGRPVEPRPPEQQGLGPDDQLTVLSHAGLYLTAVKGYASEEALACYQRLKDVANACGKLDHLYSVIVGQWRHALVTEELGTALKLAHQAHELAQSHNDPALIIGALRALTITDYWIGKFAPALESARAGVAIWESREVTSSVEEVTAPIVSCFAVEAQLLWHLGSPEQALARIKKAIELAAGLGDMNAQAVAYFNSCFVYHFCGRLEDLRRSAEMVVEISVKSSFALWLASGKAWQGWALATSGETEEGVAQMRQGIRDWRKTGVKLNTPYFLTMQAEALGRIGDAEEALELLEEAQSIADKLGEHFWAAETMRLQGEMSLIRGCAPEAAESHFSRALELAEKQGSVALRLRAAMSLCRLRQTQGRHEEGRGLLSKECGNFKEGFETADLRDARAMLGAGL
jgi:tetratricopeptide (TPR) repeat protein